MPEDSDTSILPDLSYICNELAARQGLSEEAREEIRGHLEDKLRGYLSRQIDVTADDALLLVRAHFGDARGVARQIRQGHSGVGPVWRRRRMLARFAAATAALTLLGLPLAWLISGDAAGSVGEVLTAAATMFGCLVVFEAGVLLAGWTDPCSRWQRALAALFMLPATGFLGAALVASGRAVAVRLPSGPWGHAILLTTELSCLLGHALLILLLALPIRAMNRRLR